MTKRKDDRTEDRCPNCGYCPHCGQSARAPQVIPMPYPVYPRPWRPAIGPYYGMNECVTKVNSISINSNAERLS